MSESLVKYVAVGRLLKRDDIHVVIADQRSNMKASGTAYERHVQTIMNRGADKLQPGKKIKLTSDNDDYDLHVLCDLLDSADSDRIIFFVVASTAFGQSQSIGQFFDTFKSQFYQTNSSTDLRKAKKYGGAVHKASQSLMASLIAKFGSSKLHDVQHKVTEVTQVMEKNVYTALQNVEKVENLENKSHVLADSANQFQKGATEVKRQMRCKYIKVTALLVFILLVIILVIIFSTCNCT